MRFKTARMSASLTQDMAAMALGVGRSTVAMWEAGRAVPRADKLQAMARLYRCTVDELLKQDLRDRGYAAIRANSVVSKGVTPDCDSGGLGRHDSSPSAAQSTAKGNELRCGAVLPPACDNVGSAQDAGASSARRARPADVSASRELRSRSGGAIDVNPNQVTTALPVAASSGDKPQFHPGSKRP